MSRGTSADMTQFAAEMLNGETRLTQVSLLCAFHFIACIIGSLLRLMSRSDTVMSGAAICCCCRPPPTLPQRSLGLGSWLYLAPLQHWVWCWVQPCWASSSSFPSSHLARWSGAPPCVLSAAACFFRRYHCVLLSCVAVVSCCLSRSSATVLTQMCSSTPQLLHARWNPAGMSQLPALHRTPLHCCHRWAAQGVATHAALDVSRGR